MHSTHAAVMAAKRALGRALPEPSEEDVSDEKIQELLARATARLQTKAASKAVVKTGEAQKHTLPTLDPGNLEKPYVSTKGDVAIVDATRLAHTKETQKAANGIRMVEDPVAVKKLAEEVCTFLFSCFLEHIFIIAMRKISSQNLLERIPRRRFGILPSSAL